MEKRDIVILIYMAVVIVFPLVFFWLLGVR